MECLNIIKSLIPSRSAHMVSHPELYSSYKSGMLSMMLVERASAVSMLSSLSITSLIRFKW